VKSGQECRAKLAKLAYLGKAITVGVGGLVAFVLLWLALLVAVP